jgi:hypothetical protein
VAPGCEGDTAEVAADLAPGVLGGATTSKPRPDLLEVALRDHGLDPQRTVVGDPAALLAALDRSRPGAAGRQQRGTPGMYPSYPV